MTSVIAGIWPDSIDDAYVPGAADASSTSKQVVVRLAIRHKF